MCGIVGYIGKRQAAPILLDGLSKLEYRGYDSAGIAVFDSGKIQIAKARGRLSVLRELTGEGNQVKGTVGIGHTRWATHGAPSDMNSHPHFNADETITVVHNGIIENYQKLKAYLTEKGYQFQTETDTETIVQLIDYYYEGDPLVAIERAVSRLEGSYALGVLFADFPDEYFAVRKDSPLVVGVSPEGNFIASDVPAFLAYTKEVYFMENGEIARIGRETIRFYNQDFEEIIKELETIDWDIAAAEKGGFEHFMLKEIYEQPKALRDTIHPRIKNGVLDLSENGLSEEEMKQIQKIDIVACGSAYHTGVAAKYVFEQMAGVPVEVDLASEFRYRNPLLTRDTLVIIVSQSGETADSLAALREAKKRGARVLGIVNVVGSSIAREADNCMYTWAGPEIAVATTKAYSTQLVAFYMLAIQFAKVRGTITTPEYSQFIEQLLALPDQVQVILEDKEKIQYYATQYVAAKDIFFIGRSLDYAASLEGSLKLKEISYIHSEAYAAGELKHGPIALIEDGTWVTGLLTQEALYKKTISNMVEVKSRGAKLLALTNEGNTEVEKCADLVIYIPETNPYFTVSLAVVPLQLLSYYVAVGKGFDVDKPRNLAKSVTVE